MPGREGPPSFGWSSSRLDGARGWNADQFGRCLIGVPLVLPVFGPVWNVAVVGGWSSARCWVLRERDPQPVAVAGAFSQRRAIPGFRPPDVSGHGGAGGGGGWLLVENCTVDASIFSDPLPFGCRVGFCRVFDFCVLVKLLRAHGGCLGIRSR